MISLSKPSQFDNAMEVVGCFLENEGKILLLHRQSHRPEGNTWCSVGGKVDATDKSLVLAIKREVQEETGIDAPEQDFQFVTTFYVTYPDGKNFIYHKYRLPIDNPSVTLAPDEHKDFRWIKPQDAIQLPLIQHEGDTIKHCYGLEKNL